MEERTTLLNVKRSRVACLVTGLVCICVAALGAAPAGAAVFSNATTITIPSSGNATPYPSTISVAGLGPTISDVNATLSGFSHTFPADVDVLLVGPQGQSVVLMSDAPPDDPATALFCGVDATNLNLTFDDAAGGLIPTGLALASGTFRPTNTDDGPGCGFAVDTWSTPAPTPPYGSSLAVFNGTNPNGTWSLYVFDDSGGDSGTIANGWSLDVKPSNVITVGKVKRNTHTGTATIPVTVPGPGTLSLTGKGVKAQRSGGAAASKVVATPGTVNLRVKAKGSKKKKLNKTCKVKVKVTVSFTPTGGVLSAQTKTVKLIKKLG
jgi:subtilisin-like proprotein convertase family protein